MPAQTAEQQEQYEKLKKEVKSVFQLVELQVSYTPAPRVSLALPKSGPHFFFFFLLLFSWRKMHACSRAFAALLSKRVLCVCLHSFPLDHMKTPRERIRSPASRQPSSYFLSPLPPPDDDDPLMTSLFQLFFLLHFFFFFFFF